MPLLHDDPWPIPCPGALDGVADVGGVRVFGVDYVKVTERDGGELFLTRRGWPWVEHCRPAAWYHGHRYARVGRKLTGGTGAVYHVPTAGRGGREAGLVVKFNRFAQDVPALVAEQAPRHLTEEAIENARFNGPFEEFALLRELRLGAFGPAHVRVRAKQPFAIYCPPEHTSMWRLGRTASRFDAYRRQHERDRGTGGGVGHVELHGDRVYVTIFGYVRGHNAERLYERGVIGDDELHTLSDRVSDELYLKGFRVLDHKPKHIILRLGPDGKPIRRRGEYAYAIVDFELMKRTEEYLVAHPGPVHPASKGKARA